MAEALLLSSLATLFALAALIYKLRAKNSPLRPEEAIRLREHLAWLEDRQQHADENGWDDDMKQRIATQIDDTRRKLAAHGG